MFTIQLAMSLLTCLLLIVGAVALTMWSNWINAENKLDATKVALITPLIECNDQCAKYREHFANSDRKLNELRDNVKDTIRILAERRPINFEVFKLLIEDCKCDYCVELFRDYLDFSEGFAADAAPSLADDVLAFKEEATGRGNTVEMPIPVLINASAKE